MKKSLLFIFLLIFTVSLVKAQTDDDVPLPKSLQTRSNNAKTSFEDRKLKFTAGGYLGMSFGGYTAVSVTPIFGIYPCVDWLLVGVSGTYMFTYDTYYKESYHDFGFGAYIRGLIWKQRIIAHFSYEYMNVGYFDSYGKRTRFDAHALYIGPGYQQSLGDRLNMFLVLMINIARSVDERGIFPDFYPNIGITYDF